MTSTQRGHWYRLGHSARLEYAEAGSTVSRPYIERDDKVFRDAIVWLGGDSVLSLHVEVEGASSVNGRMSFVSSNTNGLISSGAAWNVLG